MGIVQRGDTLKHTCIFLFLSATLWLPSCDHTRLSGTIESPTAGLSVSEETTLTLRVPKDLDDIYRVHWEVSPSGAAEIEYDECQNKQCEKGSGFKSDRNARITPRQTGSITISTSGFFGQTNPQPIAERTFNVVAE